MRRHIHCHETEVLPVWSDPARHSNTRIVDGGSTMVVRNATVALSEPDAPSLTRRLDPRRSVCLERERGKEKEEKRKF